MNLLVDGAEVSLAELRKIWEAPCEVKLGDKARVRVAAAQANVASVIAHGDQV